MVLPGLVLGAGISDGYLETFASDETYFQRHFMGVSIQLSIYTKNISDYNFT